MPSPVAGIYAGINAPSSFEELASKILETTDFAGAGAWETFEPLHPGRGG